MKISIGESSCFEFKKSSYEEFSKDLCNILINSSEISNCSVCDNKIDKHLSIKGMNFVCSLKCFENFMDR
jgi:hypothetical protein